MDNQNVGQIHVRTIVTLERDSGVQRRKALKEVFTRKRGIHLLCRQVCLFSLTLVLEALHKAGLKIQ